MRKSMLLTMVCLAAFGIQASAGGNDKVRPFNSAEWQASLTSAYNKKDAGLVKRHLSKLYNVTGQSKEEAAKRLQGLFKNYEKVSLDYEVLDVNQKPGVGHAVLKARTVLKGVPPGKQEFVTIVEREGFDSLVFEGGRWKMFDTVATTVSRNSELSSSEADLFAACPDGTAAVNVTNEKGDWAAWPASMKGTTARRVAKVSAPSQSSNFDPDEWSAKVVSAWNHKDVNLIADLYSSLYSHVGQSKAEVLTQTASFFQRFGNITCNYRVIDYRYLEDSKLVAVKAVIELFAEPAGGGTSSRIFSTMGYGSLVNENGVWRLYATQPYR
ncbi:MAG TPA: hypothetical protein VF762_09965 [Blastocatellia bacterium]|jgi:hypothetical protein